MTDRIGGAWSLSYLALTANFLTGLLFLGLAALVLEKHLRLSLFARIGLAGDAEFARSQQCSLLLLFLLACVFLLNATPHYVDNDHQTPHGWPLTALNSYRELSVLGLVVNGAILLGLLGIYLTQYRLRTDPYRVTATFPNVLFCLSIIGAIVIRNLYIETRESQLIDPFWVKVLDLESIDATGWPLSFRESYRSTDTSGGVFSLPALAFDFAFGVVVLSIAAHTVAFATAASRTPPWKMPRSSLALLAASLLLLTYHFYEQIRLTLSLFWYGTQ